ncbi:MAG: 30S ribosome-binding factor RbfA [Oscillospiraceae bacterium]|nr:30S ribosome-binding factor RbfA [Oscillospiraceae bacterium]
MQHRQEKINGEIRRVLAEILREVKDPRLGKMISVTGVEATNDLKQAKIFVSVLGDEKTKKEAMDVLGTSSGHIRHELGEKMELHTLPELLFELDESMDQGARIDAILNEIKNS